MENVLAVLRMVRPWVQRTYDLSAWVVGYTVMAVLQEAVGYTVPGQLAPAVGTGLVCGLAFIAISAPLRLHEGRSSIGSFDDVLLVTLVGSLVSGVALGYAFVDLDVRISVAVTGPLIAFVFLLGGRAAYRLVRDWALRRARLTPVSLRQRVVVIGAGNAAVQLVRDMLSNHSSIWLPVALLDDDPHKRHRRVGGVPVVGPTSDLEVAAERYDAQVAVLAIPSASSALVRRFNTRAVNAGLDLKVLPSVNNLSNPSHVHIEDLRDIEVSDFLGRQPVETDVEAIAGYLAGRRVLVTGAGGSIGSELCRQISRFHPAELIMLDRDESALHAVQLSITGRALLDSDDLVLGDIRDGRFVFDLFEQRRPQVVFHAAALKHLPLLEASPGEAVKTNVWGTQTVLAAATAVGVDRFVNISTDKAANAHSVLGHSKRVAEGLTAAAAKETEARYMSVRFGNVLGSRGSVLTSFTAQIATGGPITVTDPAVTRFFMTIGEAVQLVIQAGAIGSDGDVLILDMGEPVSIAGMARQLIELSGKPIRIEYTGLRQGEKLHEELFNANETDVRPHHPLVSHAKVPAFEPAEAARLTPYGPRSTVSQLLVDASRSMDGHQLRHTTRHLP